LNLYLFCSCFPFPFLLQLDCPPNRSNSSLRERLTSRRVNSSGGNCNEEVTEVTPMARRIAAILLLEPELDANYEVVKQATYP
jgi:hypothetical protein